MKNQKIKRVLIVTPSLNVGGIGRHLSVFAESFFDKGLEVDMLSCLNIKKFYQTNENIRVIRFPLNRKVGFFNTLKFYVSLIFFIRKNIKKLNPDFVLVFGEMFNPMVLLASLRLKVPVFIGDMTSADYNYGKAITLLRKLTYPLSAGLVCQTRFVEDYRNREFNNRLNTIVLDNPIRSIKEYDIPRENIILYVGRFAWEKSPDRLIKAFALIENKNGWTLCMAGDGPLLSSMKDLAVQLNCENSITFLGKVQDVDKLFAKSSIYVLPSLLEGFPNALCEAMIAGLPVVCFDGFPSDEIIDHNYNGIIIENEGGAAALSESLVDLINSPDKRQYLGNNAKELRSRLKPEVIVERFMSFVHSKI